MQIDLIFTKFPRVTVLHAYLRYIIQRRYASNKAPDVISVSTCQNSARNKISFTLNRLRANREIATDGETRLTALSNLV